RGRGSRRRRRFGWRRRGSGRRRFGWRRRGRRLGRRRGGGGGGRLRRGGRGGRDRLGRSVDVALVGAALAGVDAFRVGALALGRGAGDGGTGDWDLDTDRQQAGQRRGGRGQAKTGFAAGGGCGLRQIGHGRRFVHSRLGRECVQGESNVRPG